MKKEKNILRGKFKIIKYNNDEHLYNEINNLYFPNSKKCDICGGTIFYYDSHFGFDKNGNIVKHGKSDETKKHTLEGNFNLRVCEKCLVKRFPEYESKNKSRIFNTLSNITIFAFNIPEDIVYKLKNTTKQTESNFIKRYGENEGKLRFEEYKKKQAYSNSYEYKRKKYNMSKEEFEEYNKRRAVTLQNLINKYGTDVGTIKYEKYVERQRLTKSKGYVIEKYGESFYKELNIKKQQTLDNFKKRYGESVGIVKYNNMLKKLSYRGSRSISSISIKFFKLLDEKLSKFIDVSDSKHYSKNGEHIIVKDDIIYYLDYYLPKCNIFVEFNSDYWHANPAIYKEDYEFRGFLKGKRAKDIWEKDNKKIKILNELGIKTFIVWESNAFDNIDLLIKNILDYGKCDRI